MRKKETQHGYPPLQAPKLTSEGTPTRDLGPVGPEVADTLPAGARPAAAPVLHEDDELVTSAQVGSLAAVDRSSGYVTWNGKRIGEALARELIDRRMSQEGITLKADATLSHSDVLVHLDGYDATRRIGYQFLSHAGDDVVNDMDAGVQERLRELSAKGEVHILIINDYDARDADALLERVDAFLASLPA